MIPTDLTLAEVNAFCYGWLRASSTSASPPANVAGSTLTLNKRLFTLGQLSRFVRPGWHRIGATDKPLSCVYETAFRDAAINRIAIVLVNDSASNVALSVQMSNAAGFRTLAIYRTSATEDFEKRLDTSFGASCTGES